MLAPEVLVEAAQRLAGAIHHLLDGEVLARAGIEQLGGGIEEALDPGLGPEPGRVERPRHRLFPPAQGVQLRWFRHCLLFRHQGNGTR